MLARAAQASPGERERGARQLFVTVSGLSRSIISRKVLLTALIFCPSFLLFSCFPCYSCIYTRALVLTMQCAQRFPIPPPPRVCTYIYVPLLFTIVNCHARSFRGTKQVACVCEPKRAAVYGLQDIVLRAGYLAQVQT